MMVVHGYTEERRCRIKTGYEDAGKEGWCYGYLNLNQCWAIVRWDGEPDPDLHKIAGLEEQSTIWKDFS